MKSFPVASVALALACALFATEGNCSGPLSRLVRCNSNLIGSSAKRSCNSDMGTPNCPSQLNIMMTAELNELRDQVAALQAAAEEREAALVAADEKIAAMGDQNASLKAKLARQTKRAKIAQEQLAESVKQAEQAAGVALAAEAQAKKQIANLKKQNADAAAKLAESQAALSQANEALSRANAALESERKQREEERKQREQQAVEEPEVAIKEDEVAAPEATNDSAE